MIFIGDVHGKTKLLEAYLDANKDKGPFFQVGDMGLGFKGVELKTYPREFFGFIRGNHDSPKECEKHPNFSGDISYFLSGRVMSVGGAWSIDWQWRTPGVTWWEDEELSPERLNQAYQLYCGVKPGIMVTHEAPSKAAYEMLAGMPIKFSNYDNLCHVEKKEDYVEYKKAIGFKNTRTSQCLQQMFEYHQPKHWVFGHYHNTKDFEIEGTKFHCLNELATLEIPTE